MRAYRKSDLKSFPCWPADVCAEIGGDLNPDHLRDPALLGQFRSIFEPRWNEAIDAIQSHKMTTEHKFIVAGYWANLAGANPAMRDIGMELYEKEIQSVLPLIAKGHAPPEKLKDVRIDVKVDPKRVKALATVKLLVDAWQLCNQPWTILKNETEDEFITGDNPSSVIGGGSPPRTA
jgi:hypothetical protein